MKKQGKKVSCDLRIISANDRSGEGSKLERMGSECGPWAETASREEILAVLDNAPCCILLTSWPVQDEPVSDVLYTNKKTIEVTGYSAVELPSTFEAAKVLTPDLNEGGRIRQQVKKQITKRDVTVKYKNVSKDGTIKTMEATNTLVNGIVISTMMDVTRREEAEAAVKKMNVELENRVRRRTEEIESLAAERESLLREVQMRREEALERSRKGLRNLAQHLQRALETERTRIARDVHDEIGQFLSALKLDLSYIQEKGSERWDELKEEIHMLMEKIDRALDTVAEICQELRPPILEDFGLAAAIEWHCEDVNKRTGIGCDVKVSPGLSPLDKDLSVALFRIFQEAITNVLRHAEATAVKVSLKEERSNLILKISDNGKGIPKGKIESPRSLGIVGIRERLGFWKGDLVFKASPSRGTTMIATVPVVSAKPDPKHHARRAIVLRGGK